MLFWSNQRAWIVYGLLVLASIPSLARATDTQGHSIERITLNGYYDWTTNTAVATGMGIPSPDVTNKVQSKEMTRTAAWSVALANLLEVVNGIRVDAHTTVRNQITTNAEVQTRVEGMVRRATVVDEQELPQGEVKLTVQMYFPQEVIVPSTSTNRIKIPSAPSSPGTDSVTGAHSKKEIESKKITGGGRIQAVHTHTGVLIDARSTSVKPALRPRIMTKDNVLYDEFKVGESFISGSKVAREDQRRIAWYFTEEQKALSHPKVGPKPLVLRATQVTGTKGSDLVIDEVEAQKLELAPGWKELFYQAKVVILVDPTQTEVK